MSRDANGAGASPTVSDSLEKKINQLDDLGDGHENPSVLLFAADGAPVVGLYDGSLRVMSSKLIYARDVTKDDIQEFSEENGYPAVVPWDIVSGRFYRDDFGDIHPEVSEA